MKLTTKRLKQLIREELAHMDETRVYQNPADAPLGDGPYNAEAVDALERFRLGLDTKLVKLNKGGPMGPIGNQQYERNIKNYEDLRSAIAQLEGQLQNNKVQMDAREAMRELRMMVPSASLFFMN